MGSEVSEPTAAAAAPRPDGEGSHAGDPAEAGKATRPGDPAGAGDAHLTSPHDPSPTEVGLSPPPARVPAVVVPRWIQLVVLPLGLLALWALVRAASAVFVIFLVASLIALVLNPLVKLLQRGHIPRGVAVFGVYIGFFAALTGVGFLLANPISDQVANLQRDVPKLVDSANRSLAEVQTWLDDRGIGIEVKQQGRTALQTLQRNVLRGSGNLVSFTRDILAQVAELSFALVLILVISVYMLLYGGQIGRLVRSALPPGDGTPEDDYPVRVQKAVFGYVRGQLLFSLIMGVSAAAGLWVMGTLGVFPDGKTYALFFGAFYGLMELVPYVGPVLGALPAVLIALFGHPLDALWVALLFVALQQLEGHVVAPQVFGHSLRINPLLVIFALLIGASLYGILGAFMALPLAAIARETLVYLRRHLVLEPWGTPGAVAVATGGAIPGPVEARCTACGARVDRGDAFCRSCGAHVGREEAPPG